MPIVALDRAPGGRPRVMGVVNVTPDSFSDGGRYATTEAAIAHGLRLLEEGADILDVGGESTRPGATRPLVEEELTRVVPVIEALSEAATVSVDTMRADVAAAAVEAGASIVNDVSGGLSDPTILKVAADADVTYIAMHWRSHSDRMANYATYDDQPGGVVAAVRSELAERVDAALAAGIAAERLVLDPGLGFAKRAEHNWRLIAHLDAIQSLGYPVLVGASRKSFLGRLLGAADGVPRDVDDREHATTALTVVMAQRGVWGLRVHDVRAATDALAVLDRLLAEATP